MGYTYYNPLKVWLDPASIADVVSYMQKYLSENPIKDTEEINQIIADYIAAHPEIIGGVQSVNGETGEVVLTASDINTTGTTTIQAVLTSLSSQISEITQTVSQNTDDITDLKSALEKPFVIKKGVSGMGEIYSTGVPSTLETDGAKIYFAGKNLFYSIDRVYDRSAFSFGTLTSSPNGELTITGGTPTANINFYFNNAVVNADNAYYIPAGKYTFSIIDKSTGASPSYTNTAGYGLFYWYTDDLNTRLNYQWNFNSEAAHAITFTKDALIIPLITFVANNTFSATTLQFQLEYGVTHTSFENSIVDIISAQTAEKTLVNGTTYLWTDGTYVNAELTEVGNINNEYPVGDVRRYGIFPDGHTNWQNTSNMTNAINNCVNLGIELYWPAGYYASQLNVMRSNVNMRFDVGAEFGGLIHLVSTYSQTNAGEHPIKNITFKGTIATYSRFGMTDTYNVNIEKIHVLDDTKKNIDFGSVGPGIHLYCGNDQFKCDEIIVDGCDNTGRPSDAAIAIDGFGKNPKNFYINKIHIKDSFVHGLYLTGGGHWIGEVVVDAFGSGSYSGSGVQDSNGLEQSQELCGVWLNRVYNLYVGKIVVNQASTGTRTNAKYSIRVDQTGLPNVGDAFGSVEIGEINAYNVKDSNRGVTIGDVNYDPPVCNGHVGSVLVKCSGNGDTTYGALTMSTTSKFLVDALFTDSLGNRTALVNNSTVSKVELQA